MKHPKKPPAYLTPLQVADLLMVAPVTIRQWAQRGWLQAEVTAGGHRRFLPWEVERFARERGIALRRVDDGGMRILIVDDDTAFAGYLRERLGGHPDVAAVAIARDGFDAGAKVQGFRPGLLLLDLMMPGMAGAAVCHRLRQDPVTRGIRVIAMSGYFTPERAQPVMNAGAEVCLAKPFTDLALFSAVGLDPGCVQAVESGGSHG